MMGNSHDRDLALYDVIGPWSEIKLEVIRKYAQAYSIIMSTRRHPQLYHIYVDAFAGAGSHISKLSGMLVSGSPQLALATDPPFREYHFIDIDVTRVGLLEQLANEQPNVFVHHGDANEVLLQEILPRVRFEDYKRALCLLDPYGLHYEWSVVEALGKAQTFDVFLNFPLMDMNMNPLRRDPERIPPEQAARMTRFWGDSSWRDEFYSDSLQLDLFRGVTQEKSVDNARIAQRYIHRLKNLAGFRYVPTPLLMKNTSGGELYYLLFATNAAVAGDQGAIVEDIFGQYRE